MSVVPSGGGGFEFFLSLGFLAWEFDLGGFSKGGGGEFEFEGCLGDLAFETGEDDFFRFLGEVVGVIHFLKLIEFFLGVFENEFSLFEFLLGFFLELGEFDFEEVVVVLGGVVEGAFGGCELAWSGFLESFVGEAFVFEFEVLNFLFFDGSEDFFIEAAGVEGNEDLVFGDAGAVAEDTEDGERGGGDGVDLDCLRFGGEEGGGEVEFDFEGSAGDGYVVFVRDDRFGGEFSREGDFFC